MIVNDELHSDGDQDLALEEQDFRDLAPELIEVVPDLPEKKERVKIREISYREQPTKNSSV